MNSPEELEALRVQRELRIAQLESRLKKPRSLGVRPQVAITAIVVSLVLLWLQRSDLAYLVAPRSPIVLGSEGSYDFSGLRSNRYVQLHGTPTVRATYFQDGRKQVGVIVGLRDTPILVKRGALPGEDWQEGMTTAPRPDQRPFTVGGRLLSQSDASRYRDAFALHQQWGEVRARDGQLWLLVEGQRPGEDPGTYLSAGLLVAVLLANAYLLVRRLVAERNREVRRKYPRAVS